MFGQTGYEWRFDWGLRGMREAAARGDVIVLVDVLSFTTAVVAAVGVGAVIVPHPARDRVAASRFAGSIGVQLLYGRDEAHRTDKPSLSPRSFDARHRGECYVLASLNGAACASIAAGAGSLLLGSLRNASAAARTADALRHRASSAVTVIAAGETWSDSRDEENRLRPALEDLLGAGAVLAAGSGARSPEAEICATAFRAGRDRLGDLLFECASGRELRERGFAEDVRYAGVLDATDVVPELREGRFTAAGAP